MSYDFIVENIYFAGLLLFQSVYLCFSKDIRKNPYLLPFEIIGTFFPYYTVRNLFPKSSFRSSTGPQAGNPGVAQYALVVKAFYCTAKHMSGYFVNYLCFLGKLGDNPVMEYSLVRNLFLLGGWGTTIAMFLQTLKFKKYISPRTAMVLYSGSFPFFYLCYFGLIGVAMEHAWVTALAVVGLAVNFGPRSGQIVWQTAVCALCVAYRFDYIQL
jgi:hypothetical protein